jgi:hypothetical protein
MKSVFFLLIVFSLLLAGCSDIANAGKAFCPPGIELCYTARHLITGELACFPGNASNTENERKKGGWVYVEEGCDYLFPEKLQTATPTAIFPIDIVVTMTTPSATPIVPLSSTSENAVATAVPYFYKAQPTECAQCSEPQDCICLLVTQAVINNQFMATLASK